MVFPGATVVDITDKIQEVAMSFPSADSLLLYVGTNDVGKRQSELLKSDFIRLFSVLKHLHYKVSISGPPPWLVVAVTAFPDCKVFNTWL
jgi:hypothetical protein